MLAEAVENFAALTFPKMASPKLDGIRGTVHAGILRSRSLKDIPNVHVQKKFAGLREGLDGEFIVGDPYGPEVYDRTRRVIMESGKKTNADDVRYYVFDSQPQDDALPFHVRYDSLPNAAAGKTDVIVVPHIVISNLEELEQYENAMLSKGFEGVMLRDPVGPYKHGRSTEAEGWLVKVKRYVDDECRVLSCYEEMGNNNESFTNELGRTARSASKAGKTGNDTLGGFNAVGLTGKYKGVEFQVAVSSLKHPERKAIWDTRDEQVGKILTYKWFPIGSEEKPRHPMFKNWREVIDMSE
jgi:DNA ligase-1